jgi:uncharacterized protein YjeT (DUF2065 family)
MGFRRSFEIVLGLVAIAEGILSKEFKPMGWTTRLTWGHDENARIPRWIAGLFYVGLGLLLLYMGITGQGK